ncbi:hypothetical protein E2P81_ATG02026 [Venturia nashicola]|uniref:Uncharacterized protein n=1 Tax=Venturia nashicola TaxID=86259 RepID=A0A4Z1P4J5_9PEZI|nr:hypothetical protein E6O75_ATG02069 [Venturia nashicola]TLD35723.1 hypothetical protein E2P81_ATG02026 [Venturia nashicola]
MACRLCDGLSGSRRWIEWEDLLSSTRFGCLGCYVMTRAVQRFSKSRKLREPLERITFLLTDDKKRWFKICWCSGWHTFGGGEHTIELFTSEGKLLKMTTCISSHESCRNSIPWLPTRVVMKVVWASATMIYICIFRHVTKCLITLFSVIADMP